MKKKGFTLIEVMAVLVILVIIASIAVPAYIGYSDKAQIKVCEANCSNLATAFETAYKLESLNDMQGEADSLANVVKGRVGQAESAGTDPVVQWLLDHEYIDHDMKCPKTGEEYYVLCEKGSVKIQCHYHKDLETPVVNTGAWSSGAGSSGGFSDDDSYVYSTAAPVVTAAPDAGGEADKVDKIELLDDEGNLLSDETLTYYLSEAPDSVDGFRSRLKVKVYYKDGSSEVTTDYIIDGSYTKAIGTYSFQVRKNNATGQKADLTVKIVEEAEDEIRNFEGIITETMSVPKEDNWEYIREDARTTYGHQLPDRTTVKYNGEYYVIFDGQYIPAAIDSNAAPWDAISSSKIRRIPKVSYILTVDDIIPYVENYTQHTKWSEAAANAIAEYNNDSSVPRTGILKYDNGKLYIRYDEGMWQQDEARDFFNGSWSSWYEIPTK